MRSRLTFMLSLESLRKTTCIATIPAANGDFFGNFSLYKAPSVQGCAEIVSPSCVSSDAVFNEARWPPVCCAPAYAVAIKHAAKKGTARYRVAKFRIEL